MAGVLLPISVVTQYFSNGNQVLAGGTINTYTAGTTTPINTYTDSTLGTSNGTSLTLDTYGRPTQEMWVAAGTSVKVIIKDSSGNQLGPTLDNLTGLNDFGSGAANEGPYYAGAAGGTANALTFTFSSGPASYVGGQVTEFTATATNSGATSYNSNGLGNRAIQNNGAALVGGEIINGNTYMILDTGSAGQLLSIVGDPVTIKGSQTVTGAKTFTNGVIMSGSPVTFANRVDVASVAGTTVFDGTLSNYLNITGTNTITAITLANGSVRDVVFAGTMTLTNGASLILPGASNILTTSGDTARFIGEASGVVRCVSYTRASITPFGFVSVLGSGGNLVTPADTTEDILATVTVPANAMGANGMLRINAIWRHNNSAGGKTNRIRWSGIGGSLIQFSTWTTTNLNYMNRVVLVNKNATNAQSSFEDFLGDASGVGTILTNMTVDTTAAQTVVFTGQKTVSGDTLVLDSYSVELVRS